MSFANLTPVIIVGILLSSSSGFAVTIRHDRDDADYKSLSSALSYLSVGDLLWSDDADPDPEFRCSGTLINSSWVLTAGHCVDSATSIQFDVGAASYEANSWTAHPKWDGDLSKGYDIGVVELSGEVSDVAPAVRYSGSNELGAIATIVGFGQGGTGVTGATGASGTKRAGQNTLDRFLRTPGKTSRVLLADFDNPISSADSSWESVVPEDLEGSVAPGDSGGGLFIDVNGIDQLVGVHSFSWGRLDGDPNSDYGDAFGSTRVSQFNDWIDSIIGGGGNDNDGGGSKGGNGNGGGRGRPNLEALAGEFVPLHATLVPEPSSTSLLSVGLLYLVGLNRRRRTRSENRLFLVQ